MGKGEVMAQLTTQEETNALCKSPAERLNRDCYCKTINYEQLIKQLPNDSISADLLNTHPQLFSHTAVFISPEQLAQMRATIHAVEQVVHLPAYQDAVLADSPAIAKIPAATAGVFMGFDFHLSDANPQVIEINTNAGGGFLNAALVSAQTACCNVKENNAAENLSLLLQEGLNEEFIAMFKREWQLMRSHKSLKTIAIVDSNPTQQFLYPEFLIAQQLFERAGIKTVITDPQDLRYSNGKLSYHGLTIDLAYNRLTDFSLTQANNAALREAYENHAVVLTPNPRHHALYADKRNLALLSDAQQLQQLGVKADTIEILCNGIPHTQVVTAEKADELWQNRKQLFFKPATGYGSKAAYRGDKLTKRVWEEILQGDYVAQQQIPPSERGILVDAERTALKVDIRAYVYAGEIQLLAARLYQGQTTNFRTQGGGFAPVFVAE